MTNIIKPKNQPLLITIGGISGTGKTTVAAALAKVVPNSVHFDADRTRKELFGVSETTLLPPEAYSMENTMRLIDEMDRRVKEALEAGKTVIVSAAINSLKTRQHQEQLAQETNAFFIGITLQTDNLQVLFDRVAARVNDVSNAGVDVVKAQSARPLDPGTWPIIDAAQSRENMLEDALEIIKNAQNVPQSAAPVVNPVRIDKNDL